MQRSNPNKNLPAAAGQPIRYGRAHLPWNDIDNGWALPGGDVVSGKMPNVAMAIAERLHRLMFMKPGLYSVQAARLSTGNLAKERA